jgi:hypothetical protein
MPLKNTRKYTRNFFGSGQLAGRSTRRTSLIGVTSDSGQTQLILIFKGETSGLAIGARARGILKIFEIRRSSS